MYNWIDELNAVWESIEGKIDLNEETTKDYIVRPF